MGLEVSFDRPVYLLLLGLAPLIWWLARHSLANLGPWRWGVAIGLRTALVALLAVSLAEVQITRSSDRLAVVYVVDRSLSIPSERLTEIVRWVNGSLEERQLSQQRDLAGVIGFGSEPSVEMAPWEGDWSLGPTFETEVAGDQTNLEQALRLARASFPAHCARRVVVISDGNETLGHALEEAQAMAAEGIGFDVVPVRRSAAGDVAVDKVIAPSEAHEGAPFEVRVVLSRATQDEGATRGRLVVRRRAEGDPQVMADEPIEIDGTTRVFTVREELESAGFYAYEAQFVPEDADADGVRQNDRAGTFVQVRGEGKVLLVLPAARAGEFDGLAELLRSERFDVTTQTTDRLFTNLSELQAYDVVVLADVPRSDGDDAGNLQVFSDGQVRMLADNTQRLGCGLVMLGGPDSFGAGGWARTAVEEAMPVDFQVKSPEVVPSGALALVMDKSGSMTGDKIAMCRAAAIEAVKVLGERDYLGVYAFDSESVRVVPMTQINNREAIARRIDRLAAGGGTDMWPAMLEASRALEGTKASVKHMILLTDGQTQGGRFADLASEMRRKDMTVTAVAIGPDADTNLLAQIAGRGGGKFYRVTSPKAIPRIFMREARRVARPLVFEDERGFQPTQVASHEVLEGIEGSLPPLTGYVLTTPKQNPLVQIPLTAPVPVGETHALLALWQFGLGRSVVWTTDTGQRWAQAWNDWEGRKKLLTQILRWAMRPKAGSGRYLASAEVRGKQVQVVLNALDEQDRFVNVLAPQVSVVGPEGEHQTATLVQEAPGRYRGGFDVARTGTYVLAVSPEAGSTQLRLGVQVDGREEFQRRDENEVLLEKLAAVVPRGGEAGRIIELPRADDSLTATDAFRRDLAETRSREPAWHWMLLICGCLFFGDVLNRRWAWNGVLHDAWLRLRNRRPEIATPAAPAALTRLQSRKAELRDAWEQAYRADELADPLASLGQNEGVSATKEDAVAQAPAKAPEEPLYTERLLDAKRRAARRHDRPGP
jgi:Mg-chelatase subunit ChlD